MELTLNLMAAWIGFLLGAVSGAIPGLFFHKQDWLGGYNSWPRRLIRLGHISFFGIGFLNMAYAITAYITATASPVASALFLVAAVFMPLLCYLSAFWPRFRHFFFIPAGSVLLAVVFTLERLVQS